MRTAPTLKVFCDNAVCDKTIMIIFENNNIIPSYISLVLKNNNWFTDNNIDLCPNCSKEVILEEIRL